MMSTRFAAVALLAAVAVFDGPRYRSIVAFDLEGSTARTNLVKGELRRIMYELLNHSLGAVSITDNHLEPLTDRGDGVMVLIRPHDDVPKTLLLDRLIPLLARLLAEYNEQTVQPALRMRLRAVVHAGEVHVDNNGFYGEAIDVAIRLLDAQPVKRVLSQCASPLALVVSDEIYAGIVCHGYVDSDTYRPLVRVRIANRNHRGWVHVPDPGRLDAAASADERPQSASARRSPLVTLPDDLPWLRRAG